MMTACSPVCTYDLEESIIKKAMEFLMSMECKLVESSKALVILHNGLVFCYRNIQSEVGTSTIHFL